MMLTDTVSELGWKGSPWTEDLLASQRFLPGFLFRVAESKAWTTRQTVSRQSAALTVDRVRRDAAKKNIRGKLTEKQIAERAQSAVVIRNVFTEVNQVAPISQGGAGFLDQYLASWNAGPNMQCGGCTMNQDIGFHKGDLRYWGWLRY